MADRTFEPLPRLAEEASLLEPPSWTIMTRPLSLFTNANLHNNVFLSLDRAPSPIYTIRPIIPTITIEFKK